MAQERADAPLIDLDTERFKRGLGKDSQTRLVSDMDFDFADTGIIQDPVHFYLYEPFLTRSSMMATLERSAVVNMAAEGFGQYASTYDELKDKATSSAMNVFFDENVGLEAAEHVLPINIHALLEMESDEDHFSRPVPPGGSQVVGMIYYVHETMGVFMRPMIRTVTHRRPLTTPELEDICLEHILFDLEDLPDFLPKCRVREYVDYLEKD